MFDQNIKADAGKPRLTLVPSEIITAIALIQKSEETAFDDHEISGMLDD